MSETLICEDGVKRTLWLNPLTGATELVPLDRALDDQDREILRRNFNALEEIAGPRVGDFVRFADGTLRQISHDWDEYGVQTSDGGSWYLEEGYVSFSGGLYGCTPTEALTLTRERREGNVWFFHHNYRTAGGGVHAWVPFRVYESTEQPPA